MHHNLAQHTATTAYRAGTCAGSLPSNEEGNRVRVGDGFCRIIMHPTCSPMLAPVLCEAMSVTCQVTLLIPHVPRPCPHLLPLGNPAIMRCRHQAQPVAVSQPAAGYVGSSSGSSQRPVRRPLTQPPHPQHSSSSGGTLWWTSSSSSQGACGGRGQCGAKGWPAAAAAAGLCQGSPAKAAFGEGPRGHACSSASSSSCCWRRCWQQQGHEAACGR